MAVIKLYGKQKCDYITIRRNEIKDEDLNKYKDLTYKPIWKLDSEFLANFDNNLLAGNSELGTDFTGWDLYRKDVTNDTPPEFVATITDPKLNYIKDYMVASNHKYKYQLFAKTKDIMTSPFVSKDVEVCFNDYYLLLAEGEGDDLIVTNAYTFGLNLETSDMSNNANVNKLTNFTPYPKMQIGNSNHMSGILTCLTGYIGDKGRYKDSIDIIKELQGLNINQKRKFLKDRKGFIYEIGIQAPITFKQNDASYEQIYTVNVPWCEIKSTKNTKLISTTTLGVPDKFAWIFTKDGIHKSGITYMIEPDNYIKPNKILTGRKKL